MMKKFVLLLILTMCLSLCACGGNSEAKDSTEEIDAALNALWIDTALLPDTDYFIIKTYMFEGGNAVGGADISVGSGTNIPLTRASGTYEIKDGKIVIDWSTITEESNDLPAIIPDSELTYQYKDNTLHLTSQDGQAELECQAID